MIYLGPEGIALYDSCLPVYRGQSERAGSEVSAGWGFFVLERAGRVGGGNRNRSPAQARISSRVFVGPLPW